MDEQHNQQDHVGHQEGHEVKRVVWRSHQAHDVGKVLTVFIAFGAVPRLIERPELELKQILDADDKL